MLTFDDVYHAPLGKLKAAIDDWSVMVTDLEKLAEDARETMLANSGKADWKGVNASVTKPFIAKTAKEFADAAKAAKGILVILEQGHVAFKKAHSDLVEIIEVDAPAGKMRVKDHGKVEAIYPVSERDPDQRDPDREADLRNERSAIAALEKRIAAVVETCDDADDSMNRALRANISGDSHNFSAAKYESLDAEKADRAAGYMAKGSDLTHTQLQQFIELIKDNRKSPAFATAFYEKVGPEKAIAFFGQLSRDTYDYDKPNKERLKDVQQVQEYMGLNLATATDPDNKPHLSDAWRENLQKLGTERIPLSRFDNTGGPYGYQLLGGIMRYGNYDPRLLNPIAEHVTQLHAKNPHMFAETRDDTLLNPHPFNPSGKNGAGYDPVVSMLEALGHSPEASKEFWSADPTAYNEDGTAKSGMPDLGKDKDGDTITNYMDYFGNEDYKSFPDTVGHDPDEAEKSKGYMVDAFGHALESATLGYSHDDPSPKLMRDETSANIMEEVVHKFGIDAERVNAMEPMADSLGRMGSGYIDDINWALNNNEPGSPFGTEVSPDGRAEFGRHDVRNFLSSMGQYPDAYASISTAERIYSASMLEAQIDGGHHGGIDEGASRETVRTGAEVQGMLDQSRVDQVEAEGLDKDEKYNESLGKRSAWVQFGAGAAVGAGVAFLPATVAGAGLGAILVPLAVDTGAGAVTEKLNEIIGTWTDSKQQDSSDDIEAQRNAIFEAGEITGESPMRAFMEQNNIAPASHFGQDLEEAFSSGYSKGSDRENQQGNSPQVGG
ncbi:MAG TPA: hypothetical protein DEQ61_23710 [Streptomyces sp.]|nr:hypothetical protein [Streptomyces sp.]